MTRRVRLLPIGIVAGSTLLITSHLLRAQEFEFIASSAAHEHAVRAYRTIWSEYGERIVAALEARTCLPFSEPKVAAIIDDGISHSGGPEHPMQLRASYATDVKQSTLVHELGHRHLWQLVERLDDLDGHMTLYLVLDRVWEDVWGKTFAEERARGESDWRGGYDYAAAWTWARSLSADERARLWSELLVINGFPAGCHDGGPDESSDH
jgi:hypothetical protein